MAVFTLGLVTTCLIAEMITVFVVELWFGTDTVTVTEFNFINYSTTILIRMLSRQPRKHFLFTITDYLFFALLSTVLL